MTELLEHLQEAKELLANIVLAYDTDDQAALEGLITQAQEFLK